MDVARFLDDEVDDLLSALDVTTQSPPPKHEDVLPARREVAAPRAEPVAAPRAEPKWRHEGPVSERSGGPVSLRAEEDEALSASKIVAASMFASPAVAAPARDERPVSASDRLLVERAEAPRVARAARVARERSGEPEHLRTAGAPRAAVVLIMLLGALSGSYGGSATRAKDWKAPAMSSLEASQRGARRLVELFRSAIGQRQEGRKDVPKAPSNEPSNGEVRSAEVAPVTQGTESAPASVVAPTESVSGALQVERGRVPPETAPKPAPRARRVVRRPAHRA